MPQKRVLLVDDEPGILTSFQQILSMSDFDVVVASTVATGLALIQTQLFDALITDLNIGQPGDGFTLVSAMRRTQPDAVTVIITGFPAFDTALEAIRSQVDDYFVKPMDVAALLKTLRARLGSGRRHQQMEMKRVVDVVAARRDAIISDWIDRFRSGCTIPDNLSDEELTNSVPEVMAELVASARSGEVKLKSRSQSFAAHHGELRFRQGFTVDVFLRESRFLRQAILHAVHSSMLEVNLSYVFGDLAVMSEALDEQLEISLSTYIEFRDRSRRSA